MNLKNNYAKWNNPDTKRCCYMIPHVYEISRRGQFIQVESRLRLPGIREVGIGSYSLVVIDSLLRWWKHLGNNGDGYI